MRRKKRNAESDRVRGEAKFWKMMKAAAPGKQCLK